MQFWKENEKHFPNIAKKARKLLAIPATSKLLAKTGPHRRRMSDTVAEQIFFRKGNSHLFI